jgi:hypothetical protein
MLMISATAGWTEETPQVGNPEMRRLFTLAGAPEYRLAPIQIQAEHNFKKPTREAMYSWMAPWLKGTPGFDPSDDATYVDRLYIPGVIRAGGLEAATRLTTTRILLHDAARKGFQGRIPQANATPTRLDSVDIVRSLQGP